MSDFNIGGKGEAIFFDQHIYSPLLRLRNEVDTDGHAGHRRTRPLMTNCNRPTQRTNIQC